MPIIAVLLLLVTPALAQPRPVEPNRDPALPEQATGALINQMLAQTNIADTAGLYLHLGGGWTGPGPGVSGAIGLFHHTLFGGEVEVATRFGLDTRLAAAVRVTPWRLGLSTPWRSAVAPSVALLVSVRAGGCYFTDDARPGVLAGVDAELLLWRRFVLALRTSLAPVRGRDDTIAVWPTAVVAVGVAPGGRYGAE